MIKDSFKIAGAALAASAKHTLVHDENAKKIITVAVVGGTLGSKSLKVGLSTGGTVAIGLVCYKSLNAIDALGYEDLKEILGED